MRTEEEGAGCKGSGAVVEKWRVAPFSPRAAAWRALNPSLKRFWVNEPEVGETCRPFCVKTEHLFERCENYGPGIRQFPKWSINAVWSRCRESKRQVRTLTCGSVDLGVPWEESLIAGAAPSLEGALVATMGADGDRAGAGRSRAACLVTPRSAVGGARVQYGEGVFPGEGGGDTGGHGASCALVALAGCARR